MTPLFSQKHLPVWAGLLGALAVYAPAFCVVFGMHSDAVFIPMTFAQRDIFFESRQLLAVGRPLLTALLTLTGWLIHRTEDLAVGRLAAWAGLMLWTGALLRFLARRYRVEAFWRGIIGAAVVLLPSSQLFVLWVIQAVQGLSTITLALGAYVLLDRGRPGPRLVAAVLFLAALFIYQPTAMMVFTLTAAGVFFSPLSSWPVVRRRIARDVLFFGGLMAVYFVFVVRVGWMSGAGGTYEMEIAADPAGKAALVWETAAAAWAGMGHVVYGQRGAWFPLAILSTAGLLAARCGARGSGARIRWGWGLQAAAASAGLFVLVNAPMFLARGTAAFTGYRVLLPAAVFMVFLQAAGLRAAVRRCGPGLRARMIRGMVLLGILAAGLSAARHVRDVVANYRRERVYLNARAAEAPADIRRFLVLRLPQDRGVTLIGRPLPFEFSWMISSNVIAGPMLWEQRRAQGLAVIPSAVDAGGQIFYDEQTGVIDMNAARHPPQAFTGTRILVKTSRAPDQEVTVSRQAEFLVFEQVIDGKRMPFWTAAPLAGRPPWVELDFGAAPRRLKSFVFGVFSTRVTRADPVRCRLWVRRDGESWHEVPLAASPIGPGDPYRRVYRLAAPATARRYRLLLVPEDGRAARPVSALQLSLDLEP